MNRYNQLEHFREKWKIELQQKGREKKELSSSKQVVTPNPPLAQSSISTSSEQSKSYFHSNDETPEEAKIVKDTHADAEPAEYYPFSIVEGLLNESGNITGKGGGRKRKNIDKDVSYCANVVNKKLTNSARKKKMKFDTFKDLFSKIWSNQQESEPEQCLLDKLIADIDEITEVPFFDISLPKEIAVKIFQFLSLSDLCHCALVSKSWKTIAEDELLWCRVCHRLGQEVIYTTNEKSNWKQIVQHNVERQRLLEVNWKSRLGKLSPLEYHQGKVLYTAMSKGDQVLAGYTNGDVKLWDLYTGDSCIYSPSSTALMVVEDEVNTVRYNFVESVVLSETVAAASFSQGNVDIWNLGAGTQPVQTYTMATREKASPTLCLSKDGSALTVTHGAKLDLLYRKATEDEYTVVQQLASVSKISHVKFHEDSIRLIPNIIYSEKNTVNVCKPVQPNSFGSESHVTEIHNMIGASVDVVDYKDNVLAVGVGSNYDFTERYKISIYDMSNGKCNQTLHGHTWSVTCLNMLESPEHELVTGSADRKVRVYDLRTKDPVQTFMRHSCSVTSVQMDEWKVVSAAYDGFMCLFDRRMSRELWDLHNRHPVRHCHFHDKYLVVANIPGEVPADDGDETAMQRRYRGTINVYNFLVDMTSQDVPEICLSTYEEPTASRYNISLAVPYDTLQF